MPFPSADHVVVAPPIIRAAAKPGPAPAGLFTINDLTPVQRDDRAVVGMRPPGPLLYCSYVKHMSICSRSAGRPIWACRACPAICWAGMPASRGRRASPDGETVVGTDYLNVGHHVVQFYGHDEELAEGVVATCWVHSRARARRS